MDNNNMLLMVYPTFDNGHPPVLLTLDRNFTSEQFLKFMIDLTDALNKPQDGYDHARMTIVVMERESVGWVAKANLEVC